MVAPLRCDLELRGLNVAGDVDEDEDEEGAEEEDLEWCSYVKFKSGSHSICLG